MLHYLVNFFYPPRSAACEVRLGSDARSRLCGECYSRIDRMPEPLCDVCGITLAVIHPDAYDSEAAEWCTNCRTTPPHFTRARAVVRYRHDADDDEHDVVPS